MRQKLILIVDDEESVRIVLKALFRREGYEVETAADGDEAIRLVKELDPNLVIMDVRMPKKDGMQAFTEIREFNKDVPVILMTAFVSIDTVVEAMKMGAFDYIIKPFNNDELKILANRALTVQKLKEEVQMLHQELSNVHRLDMLMTNNIRMTEIYKLIGKVAETNATVLITGESGTGKEVIANTIHYNSSRRTGPFIKVNCGALPEGLLESELFGHEKGAFTGAVKRRAGRFELAQNGTIFLDEIGEITPDLQVRLLRVLQEHEFETVGGTDTIKGDFRVIAATNKNLKKMVEQGKFREDLYYRLNVVPIQVPSLRERKEDIVLFGNYFLQKFARENNKPIIGFHESTIEMLEKYSWPGNIRELSNVVERAVIMCTGSMIFPDDLSIQEENLIPEVKIRAVPEVDSDEHTSELHPSFQIKGDPFRDRNGKTLKLLIKELESNIIRQRLQANKGNKMKTAKELGISRRALLYKIEEYELEDIFSSEEEK